MKSAEKLQPAENVPEADTVEPIQPSGRPATIARMVETGHSGIRSFETSRYCIGYLVSGTKHLYHGDQPTTVTPGDIFFIGRGTHYVEDIPDSRTRRFEQVMFLYTPEQLGRIIASMSIEHGVDTTVRHSCPQCMARDHVVAPGWRSLQTLMGAAVQLLRDGFYVDNPAGEMLTLASLVQQIVARPECCLRSRVMSSTDPEKELMERLVNDFVFEGISLSEYARRSNRSLSSFKKKFKEYFHETPHRWVVRRRLAHARLELIQTTKPVIQIATECLFNNSSHFITSFRKEFGMTPVQFRKNYRS